MVEINEEILCDFCREHFEESLGSPCEGVMCEEIQEIYLEKVGINYAIDTDKSFKKLNIGDEIFLIDSSIVPKILVKRINSLENMNNNGLSLHYDSTSVKIDDENSDKQGDMFLKRKDADKRLEEICVERIVELSKVIGKI